MKRIFALCMAVAPLGAFAGVEIKGGCSVNETWKAPELGNTWRRRFGEYLAGQMSPMEGMALANLLRRTAEDTETQLLGEYWLSHALRRAELSPMAHRGFAEIISQDPDKDTLPLQRASLECVLAIHHENGARRLPEGTERVLPLLEEGDLRSHVAYRWILENKITASVRAFIQKGSQHDELMTAYQGSRDNEYAPVAKSLDAYFARSERSKYLTSQDDHWHLLAGRAHYAIGTLKAAKDHWQKVGKRSNQLVPALTELAWAQIRSEEYNSAIGSALSLQTGWLQNTYSPEGLMVMAIAFNETCHFPEALRAVELFRRQYQEAAAWLADPKNHDKSKLYGWAAATLKKDPLVRIPFRVAGEWLRSPHFLERQGEINRMLGQGKMAEGQYATARIQQKKLVTNLLKEVRTVRADIEKFRRENPRTAGLSPALEEQLEGLRARLEDYDSLRRFAPVWSKIDERNRGLASVRSKDLMRQIAERIEQSNQKLHAQFLDVSDNLKFVEVEIYQGATQDMIFSNSHPDFEKKMAELKKKKGWSLDSGTQSWGNISTVSLQSAEIWEDELGGFSADLPNKCEKGNVL
jgi:hypothetical protein